MIFQQSTKKGPADKPAFFLEEHALSAMEHPHWVMVAGTVLVVLGVIGLNLAKTRVMPGERWTPEEEKRLLDLIAAGKS